MVVSSTALKVLFVVHFLFIIHHHSLLHPYLIGVLSAHLEIFSGLMHRHFHSSLELCVSDRPCFPPKLPMFFHIIELASKGTFPEIFPTLNHLQMTQLADSTVHWRQIINPKMELMSCPSANKFETKTAKSRKTGDIWRKSLCFFKYTLAIFLPKA